MTWTEQVDARIAIVREQMEAARELGIATGRDKYAFDAIYNAMLSHLMIQCREAEKLDAQCSNSTASD